VSAADSSAARAEEGFWVAVLPFKDSGGNADLTALAKGLAEDTVTGLSRFSYLRVISRSSTAHYANESADVCAAGKRTRCPLCDGRQPAQAGTKLRSSHRRMKRDVGATIQRDVERWRCSGSQVVADLSQLGTSGSVKCFGISRGNGKVSTTNRPVTG